MSEDVVVGRETNNNNINNGTATAVKHDTRATANTSLPSQPVGELPAEQNTGSPVASGRSRAILIFQNPTSPIMITFTSRKGFTASNIRQDTIRHDRQGGILSFCFYFYFFFRMLCDGDDEGVYTCEGIDCET
jgi:hypothetical protein